MHQRPTQAQSAFTMLELSIMLMIVALIAGAIVLGRTMIESSATQAIAADFDSYRNAVLAYRDKYRELPGDHTGAVAVTGVAAETGCSTPSASDTAAVATCNGDGDGMIGDSTGNPLGAFTNYYESLLVWQHLRNDSLITGKYNGRQSTASNGITVGVNVPTSKLGRGSFILRNFPTNTFTSNSYTANYGHVFFFGAPGTAANLPFNGAVLTTEQAKSVDQKIDDGAPGMGKVLTSPATVTTCVVGSSEETAIYSSAVEGPACALIFITGF